MGVLLSESSIAAKDTVRQNPATQTGAALQPLLCARTERGVHQLFGQAKSGARKNSVSLPTEPTLPTPATTAMAVSDKLVGKADKSVTKGVWQSRQD